MRVSELRHEFLKSGVSVEILQIFVRHQAVSILISSLDGFMQILERMGVELPKEDTAYDLNNGELTVGSLVNATLMPGATFQLAAEGATAK